MSIRWNDKVAGYIAAVYLAKKFNSELDYNSAAVVLYKKVVIDHEYLNQKVFEKCRKFIILGEKLYNIFSNTHLLKKTLVGIPDRDEPFVDNTPTKGIITIHILYRMIKFIYTLFEIFLLLINHTFIYIKFISY